MKVRIDQKKIISLVKSMRQYVKTDELKQRIELKGPADFVTQVDKAISSDLKEKLHDLYPKIGFFSEEESGSLQDPCWILDPIDGTTNLVYGMPYCSVSLALYTEGKITFGVVYNPFTRECFHALRGHGAFIADEKMHVSGRDLADSIVEFGAGCTRKEQTEENFAIAQEVFRKCTDVRRICSSALDLCYLAQGRIDGYFEKILKPWDIAAGSLILEEAGGMITDYDGVPIQFVGETSVVASNGIIHESLVETVQMYARR